MKKNNHNFNDGRGEVPAYQWVNPDKSEGGWVAESVEISAEIKAELYIGKFAILSGYYKTTIRGGTILGGTIRGGEIWGGEIWGGTIRGGTILGGKILGGKIWGGTILGGEIWGGEIWGGEIWGGKILGGEIWGGTILGGKIWGGTILGGTILGGEIWGGEIWGGTILGGTIPGGEIRTNRDFIVFSCVGSRNDNLTVQFDSGEPLFTTGCKTRITLKEFESANKETHGGDKWGMEYKIILKCVNELWKIRKIEKQ
jgi:hypothetical protein